MYPDYQLQQNNRMEFPFHKVCVGFHKHFSSVLRVVSNTTLFFVTKTLIDGSLQIKWAMTSLFWYNVYSQTNITERIFISHGHYTLFTQHHSIPLSNKLLAFKLYLQIYPPWMLSLKIWQTTQTCPAPQSFQSGCGRSKDMDSLFPLFTWRLKFFCHAW